MIKNLIKVTVLAFLIWSCNRIDIYPDHKVYPGYPTIINKLPAATLLQNREAFSSKYPLLISSLTDFGFCGFSDDLIVVDPPPVGTPLTESEAVETVKNFVADNAVVTGVKSPAALTFYQIFFSTGYYDGGTSYTLKTNDQKVDTIEVLNSQIIFNIRNRELVSCTGNWFPEIYIPVRFNVDQTKAANSLLNHVVGHSTIAGQIYHVKITSEDLNNSSISLKILPVTTDDSIELHVCWQFDIPGPVFYKIFVDVMNGKIVEGWPTIIS